VIAKLKTITAATGTKGQIKAKHRTMRIVGCSFLLAQQLAVLFWVPISILGLHMTGVSFIFIIIASLASFLFLGLCTGIAATMLWCAIKSRPIFPN